MEIAQWVDLNRLGKYSWGIINLFVAFNKYLGHNVFLFENKKWMATKLMLKVSDFDWLFGSNQEIQNTTNQQYQDK